MILTGPDGKVIRIIPEPPEPRFWMTEELLPLQERLDAEGTLPEDDWIRYCRLRGRRDLYFFAKYLAGCNLLVPELHGPLCWAWQRPNGKDPRDGLVYGNFRMAILPRGSYKTYSLTQAYAMWRLVRNPDERILIWSHKVEFAEKILSRIRNIFEGKGAVGQFFLAVYGDLIPGPRERSKWTQHTLTILRPTLYTDPSIEAGGVGSGLTGGHYTVELIDDPVNRKLTRTEMEKVIDEFDNLTPLLVSQQTSERRAVMTPWGFYDVVAYIRRHWPNALIALRSAIEDGKLLLPSAYTWEELNRIKRASPFFFSCQYLCNPSDEEKQGFKQQWFRYFRRSGQFIIELDGLGKESRRVNLARCNIFIFVDPNTGRTPGARSEPGQVRRRDNDYIGIIVLAVSEDNIWYVLKAERARRDVTWLVNEVFALVDYYSPKFVAIEQRAAQYLFNHIFYTEFKRRNRVFVLEDWVGGVQSKEERINALQPRYANGMIFHLEEDPTGGTQALECELLDFPHAEYDDLSDALSGACPKVYGPKQLPANATVVVPKVQLALDTLDDCSRWVQTLMEKERNARKHPQGEFWA